MTESENRNYVAITGIAEVSTGNPNLDGTGSMETVLTASDDGTVVSTITIKATGSNEPGMIRLFIYKNENTFLWRELPVEANVQAATIPSFQRNIKVDLTLEAGDVLKASTQNSENWIVIADAIKWVNDPCVPTEQLATPTGLSLTGIGQAINCVCDDVTNAENYEWQRADDSIFTTNVVTGSLTLSEFIFGGLIDANTYFIRVRAKGAGYLDSEWIESYTTPEVP